MQWVKNMLLGTVSVMIEYEVCLYWRHI